MTNIDWTSFLVASLAVVLAPGPGSLFVARTAVVSGTKAGYRAMLGIVAGDTCLITLSVLGVSALFRAYPSVFQFFKLAGAAYLFLLGVRLLVKKPRTEPISLPGYGRSFIQAISITLLNPKAVLFFMAFFPLFLKSPEPGQFFSYTLMAFAFQCVSATYLSALIHASSWTASTLRRNTVTRTVLEKLCGCAFIGFGLKVALAKR
jgi:leucine efflux protein